MKTMMAMLLILIVCLLMFGPFLGVAVFGAALPYVLPVLFIFVAAKIYGDYRKHKQILNAINSSKGPDIKQNNLLWKTISTMPKKRMALYVLLIIVCVSLFVWMSRIQDNARNTKVIKSTSPVPEKRALPIADPNKRLDELVQKGIVVSYRWDNSNTLSIRLHAKVRNESDLEEFIDLASSEAQYYHRIKGHTVCVQYYYVFDGREHIIARSCR
jgi:predicted RND superfamily exporter protein